MKTLKAFGKYMVVLSAVAVALSALALYFMYGVPYLAKLLSRIGAIY